MSAAAYRLAGIGAIVVEPEETVAALEDRIPPEVRLLLMGAANARAMNRESLISMIRRGEPAVMVVPDAGGRTSLPDFPTLLRQRLGVAT